MSEVRKKVKEIVLAQLGVDETEITDEASFVNDLGADTLDTIELVMQFEQEFNIRIPDDKAESIDTVGKMVDYIERQLAREVHCKGFL